jgi:hypothetical protein
VLIEDESKVGQFRVHIISTNYGISNGQRTFPAGREAIISQFRVWPFLPTVIVTSGERNRNPGHHFAGVYIIMIFLFKWCSKELKSDRKKIIVRI